MSLDAIDILRSISGERSLNIDQNLSIYIPYIDEANATEEYIKHIFFSLDIGIVKYVDFHPKYSTYTNEDSDKSAFVYMEMWFKNPMVKRIQEKINNDEEFYARIVHDDPYYWVLKKNNNMWSVNYDKQFTNLQKNMLESNKQMNQRILLLEEKNNALETTIAQMKWVCRLHDANINYICNRLHATPSFDDSNIATFATVCATRLGKRVKSYDCHSTC